MQVNLNDEREKPTPCPVCSVPMVESDPYLDMILRRRGFLMCIDESCVQQPIEKPLRTKEPSRG